MGVFGMAGKTAAAVLNSVFKESEISAAAVAEGIKRTVAEHTVKGILVRAIMAGEISAFFVLKEKFTRRFNHLIYRTLF